jgi:GAF domain-containing protein
MRRSLSTRLTAVFIGLAVVPLLLVGVVVALLSFSTLQQQALNIQKELALRVSTEVNAFFGELENALRLASRIERLQTLDLDRQRSVLSLLISEHSFEDLALLDSQGLEISRISRSGITSDDPVDHSQEEKFLIPSESGEIYYSAIRFDATTGEPLMTITMPLLDLRTGQTEGALISEVRVKTIWDLLGTIEVGPGQTVYIVDAQGRVIAHRDPSVVLRGTTFEVPGQDGLQPGLSNTSTVLAVETVRFGEQEFNIVVEQEWSDALALARNTVLIIAGLMAATLLIAGGLGLLTVRQIVQPIRGLVAAAEAVSAGDLTAQAPVTSRDEIGTLATAFNSMTTQLRASVTGLEQRVTDRTRALALSADISRRLSTILDQPQLVHEVVEQLRMTYNYYHVHMYLWDETQRNLVMVGGTGDAGRTMLGRGHQIPRGRGLVGRAADSNLPVLVADVGKDPQWLANPLLPDTKAEVAVPITAGDTVLGVLDVQHNVVGGLKPEDIELIQSIANQVAIALRNIRAYKQAQQQAGQGELINLINQRIQSTTDVETALQIAAREVGRALGAPRVSVRLKTAADGAGRSQPNPPESVR